MRVRQLRLRPNVIPPIPVDQGYGDLAYHGNPVPSCAIRFLLLCVILMTTVGGTIAACHASESHTMNVKRSDVVFNWTPETPEAYRQYGATLVAWGFCPSAMCTQRGYVFRGVSNWTLAGEA